MFQPPPIPSWDGLHPLVIHFPIALLLVAPIFVLIGAFAEPKKGKTSLVAALLLMILGTSSLFLAVATGEAAGERVVTNAQASAVLEEHEEMAETARAVFSALTVVLALIIFVPAMLRREVPRRAFVALPIIFLFFYGAGALLLANTAHQGGRLVHEFGVRAVVAGTSEQTPGANETGRGGERETDDHGQRGRDEH